jgi:hypothetical protein
MYPTTYILAMNYSVRFKLYISENHISIAISVYEKMQRMFMLCTRSELTVTGTSSRNTSVQLNSSFFLKVGVCLVPKRGCLLTLAYYAFSRRYEFRERKWNDILTGENRRTRRKSCPSATLSTTNPTWIDPGANPCLRRRGRRLTTWAMARHS